MTYIARYLGPSGFGVLSFALAFTGIFAVFADFGLQLLITREVARDKNLTQKYLANFSLMKIILAVFAYGLIAIIINLMAYPWQTILVVYLLGVYVICSAFTQMFYSTFQAYERMEFQAIGQFLNSVLMLVSIVVAIRLGLDIVIFAYIYVAVALVTLIYSYIVMKSRFFEYSVNWVPNMLEMDRDFWKLTFKRVLPFGLSQVFVTSFYWISTILLSLMKGDAMVGWYNASYRMVLILSFIPAAVIAAIYPVMAKLFVTSQDTLKIVHERSLKYLATLAIPLGIGTTILASRFISLIFGSEYAESVTALQILVWSEVCIFISMPLANLFNSMNKQLLTMVITAICLIINVVFNLALIPQYGLIGASATTVLTEAVSLILCLVFAAGMSHGFSSKNIKYLAKVITASILMGLYILLIRELNLILIIVSSVLLYFFLLYAIKGIGKEDINLIKLAVNFKGY
jgi:O-antigen/teichoic acid export membrane protein